MKRLSICISIVLSIVAFGSTAWSQSKAPKTGEVRAGVGVSLTSEVIALSTIATGTGHLHIPVQFGPSFRLEPTVGFASNSDSDAYDSFVYKRNTSLFNVGLGAYYTFSPAKSSSTLMYAGPRVGFTLENITRDETDGESNTRDKLESSQMDIYGGVAFGGEHFFAKTFSIGAESRFSYIANGDTETTSNGTTVTENNDENNMILEGLITVRLYFL